MVQGLFEDEDRNIYTAGDQTDRTGETPEPFILSSFTPESTSETIRKSGLAWSAGIAFFGAIVFMLFLGWIADVLLGSSPWGVVGGIVLGSIIGFLQFFRITSRIFQSAAALPAEHPLMSPADESPKPNNGNENR